MASSIHGISERAIYLLSFGKGMLILFLLFFSLHSALFHFATEKSPKMKREQGKSDITI